MSSVPEYQWKAMLTLEPDTQYCYRVYLGAIDLLGTDPSPRFWTQIPAGSTKPFSFVVFGDWGYTNSEGLNPEQAALMQRIAESGARFALTVGDNAYPSGSQKNYGDLVQTGPSASSVFGPSFWAVPGRSILIFPATGNHGYSSTDTYHPHLINFPQDRAVALSSGTYARENYCCQNGTIPGIYPWYAFDAGTVRIYNLTAAWADDNVGDADKYENDYDYHWTISSAEYQWLEADLQAHPDQVKLAVLHFPIYSDSSAQESDAFLQGPVSLEGLLGRYGVKIAFTGHAHFYERNHPNADGLVTYITGGGGAKVASVNHCSPFNAYAIGWSFTQNAGNSCNAPVPTSHQQVYHFLLVSVDGTNITVTPTNATGATFDVQTYTATTGGGGGGDTDFFVPEADAYVQQTTPAANYGREREAPPYRLRHRAGALRGWQASGGGLPQI
ncbi:MAG: metallophosphoesterase [Sphaerobacter sp.]|nr:metallophosphoesterase [Sphaerobacter sp.]